jgi:hypothetical protein
MVEQKRRSAGYDTSDKRSAWPVEGIFGNVEVIIDDIAAGSK